MGIFSRVERDGNDFFRSRRGGDIPTDIAPLQNLYLLQLSEILRNHEFREKRPSIFNSSARRFSGQNRRGF
jgi:hypothetical protein